MYSFVLIALLVPSLSQASFDVSLKYGSRGANVIELQDFLQDQNLYIGKVDGKFGLGTLRAIKAFQTANNLGIDGYFGSATRAKADEILAADLEGSNAAEQAETGTVAIVSNVEGCAPGNAYSTLTGQPCNVNTQPIAGLPNGCTALSGYSITTGKKCSGETTQPVLDQATQDKLTALNVQIQTLSNTLNTIASNTTPVTTPAPTSGPITATPQVITFTKAPKFLFIEAKKWSDGNVGDYSLPKILFETSRPAKIVFGPTTNPDGVWIDKSIDGTSQMTLQSCGRNGVSPGYVQYGSYGGTVNGIVCTIRAQADDGAIVETHISVTNDSIIIPTANSPYIY